MDLEGILKRELFAYHPGARLWFCNMWEETKKIIGSDALNSPVQQLKAILLAVALKKLFAEFYHQLENDDNEVGSLDVFDLMDQLEWSEEVVWFLAGVYSINNKCYEEIMNTGDIHEMLDFMVTLTAKRTAELLLKQTNAERLFVCFYMAEGVDSEKEKELENKDHYDHYIQMHMSILNDMDSNKKRAFEWIYNSMPLSGNLEEQR